MNTTTGPNNRSCQEYRKGSFCGTYGHDSRHNVSSLRSCCKAQQMGRDDEESLERLDVIDCKYYVDLLHLLWTGPMGKGDATDS